VALRREELAHLRRDLALGPAGEWPLAHPRIDAVGGLSGRAQGGDLRGVLADPQWCDERRRADEPAVAEARLEPQDERGPHAVADRDVTVAWDEAGDEVERIVGLAPGPDLDAGCRRRGPPALELRYDEGRRAV
jgi:hypothetical protein